MKFLICCPNCRCEDLDFLKPNTKTILKCLNRTCKHEFYAKDSGYNTREYEPINTLFKGKKQSEYIDEQLR